jgi:hypothetical protein
MIVLSHGEGVTKKIFEVKYYVSPTFNISGKDDHSVKTQGIICSTGDTQDTKKGETDKRRCLHCA